ncbi:MAG: uncharacterized protein JWQ94_3006 [Tardiphaga sp.]|jgi:hypothetical protein|nr:uncharacterized protein [Tardiphaga sp.]
MALGPDDLVKIEQMLSVPGADGHVFADLRKAFPHLSWTRCDASDLTEAPYRSYSRFDIHLLDSADHCVTVTIDPVRATGIVLAERNAE